MAADDRTPGVEWTAAEREAVATTLGCKPSAHDAACLTHNMPGNWGNRGHWMDESNDILDALAPFVAERERAAAAKALRDAAGLFNPVTGSPLSPGNIALRLHHVANRVERGEP